ncbi:helicase-related protein [Streptomyces griseorubiginosus]
MNSHQISWAGRNSEGRDVPAELRVLSSVRVLGEGVDTAECDAVLFADARGSMVDIVQMVGRALRLNPDHGKLATLIVPVFLGPDEDPNELLTSDAYNSLTKVLGSPAEPTMLRRSKLLRGSPAAQQPPCRRRRRRDRRVE